MTRVYSPLTNALTDAGQGILQTGKDSWLSIGEGVGDVDSNLSFVVNSSLTDESNLSLECMVALWTCVCSCSQSLVDEGDDFFFLLMLLFLL